MNWLLEFDRCIVKFVGSKYTLGINYRAAVVAILGSIFYWKAAFPHIEWYWNLANTYIWCRLCAISWGWYQISKTWWYRMLLVWVPVLVGSIFIIAWLDAGLWQSSFCLVWGSFVAFWWDAGRDD